jgi:hypothetical protein
MVGRDNPLLPLLNKHYNNNANKPYTAKQLTPTSPPPTPAIHLYKDLSVTAIHY